MLNSMDVLEIASRAVAKAKEDNAIFIGTTDRKQYKNCRRAWNWSSKIRMNLRPAGVFRMPLDFGTAWHKAMEILYDPATWYLTKNPETLVIIEGSAISGFKNSMLDTRKVYLKETGREFLEDEDLAEWNKHYELGPRMLTHYFVWRKEHDKHLTPVAVELEFCFYLFDDPITGRPVYYRGRIDFLLMDDDGFFWIMDHKSAATISDDTAHLDFDEQLGSYNLAIAKMLQVPVAGNLYNEAWKAAPDFPTVNKRKSSGRLLSVAKDQPTTYDIMVASIEAYNEDPALYADYLYWLKEEGPTFFKRTQFHRNVAELNDIHKRILVEAREMVMVTDEDCYPNPDRGYKCTRWCAFRAPCLAHNDGSDVEYIIRTNYVRND